jgi:predicted transcriptional regulator of viral defense system
MTKMEIAKQVLSVAGGVAKTADLLNAGLTKSDVCALTNDGFLKRIRHGYYQLADNTDISEEQLIASLIPEGIVCVESALFHYGYSDFSPRIWTIAVPRTISRAKLKIDALNFKPYFIPKEHYELGKTTATFNGVTLAVYDRERTICDCFKYRTRLDNETFNKAIHAYVADDKKDLSNLSKYAKKLGLFKKVNELMEVLLNG